MASLKYISYYFPSKTIDNFQLSLDQENFSPEKIKDKVGISLRYRVNPNQLASDLGIAAANKLFTDYLYDKSKVDFLLFCTQSPDYFLPTTACLIQDKLGLNNSCGALDFNLGCSGFTYGLMLAKALIDSKSAKNVLLITAETYSLHINPSDISNQSIFSDAAAATLITGDENNIICQFDIGTDGSGADNLIVNKGSLRHSLFDSDVQEYFHMNGAEVFKFTLFSIPNLVSNILKKNNLFFDEIDLFIFHQASKVVLESLKKKLKIPDDKFFNCLEFIGNTVSSTIPIAIKKAQDEGKIVKGSKVLIAGFGVGYSWSGTIIKF
jgi:3-oxoacyl-[acyl-carrier-protein] synthase-3